MRCANIFLLAAGAVAPGLGQNTKPLGVPINKTVQVPLESVWISGSSAKPDSIFRSSGPFFLSVSNEERHAAPLDLRVVPAVLPTNSALIAPVLDLSGLNRRGRSTVFVNFPPGEYYIQESTTGKNLCTLTIKGSL